MVYIKIVVYNIIRAIYICFAVTPCMYLYCLALFYYRGVDVLGFGSLLTMTSANCWNVGTNLRTASRYTHGVTANQIYNDTSPWNASNEAVFKTCKIVEYWQSFFYYQYSWYESNIFVSSLSEQLFLLFAWGKCLLDSFNSRL